ncbi:MAG: preprotein translocase subunit SecG [Gemmatimonadetes bacterium]|nr:preprotein translocase subunit SecG [Gemmatimonadota bacterium]
MRDHLHPERTGVFNFLLILLLLDGLLLMVIVLLQAGKGGGLAAVGGGAGTETFIGGRQAATLLTRATWVTAGIFLLLALMLSVMSSRRTRQPEPVLRQEFPQTAPAPQPVLPGVEPGQGTAPQGGAQRPARPAEPVPAPPAQR